MIAGCPKCGARYRIEAGRLRPEGVRLRCSRCEAVFRVTPPEAAEPPQDAEALEADPQRTVLVADADVEAAKSTAHALGAWGLSPVLVHDGVEAILTIQRMLPRAVVLDAGLPKMFGFQICELMKRNESLRTIPVVLVGSIHHRDRYRRAPTEMYGADAYVERHQLPEALRPILDGFGLQLRGAAPPETPAAPTRTPPAAAPPAAPPRAAGGDAAVAAAERLARIIVSDVVLYNPEKFEAGVREGNVLGALETELEEGRSLFDQRVDARLRQGRDFLSEELVRVARTRGMK